VPRGQATRSAIPLGREGRGGAASGVTVAVAVEMDTRRWPIHPDLQTAVASETFIAQRSAELMALLADPGQWLALAAGIVAAGLILVSAFVKTIMPLRWLAVASNIGFVVRGRRGG